MLETESKNVGRLPDDLPSSQRIAHYREMSAQAFVRSANTSNQDTKAKYLSMALAWEKLATEVERLSKISANTDLGGN